MRVLSASQSRKLAASPPRHSRRATRISLLINTYSVLRFFALCAFHFLSTQYLYLLLPRVAARFVSCTSHPAINRRAAAPSVKVRSIPAINRAIASHLSRKAVNQLVCRLSNSLLRYLKYQSSGRAVLSELIAHAVRPCSSHFTF